MATGLEAALNALHTWVDDGPAPAGVPRLAPKADGKVARDLNSAIETWIRATCRACLASTAALESNELTFRALT